MSKYLLMLYLYQLVSTEGLTNMFKKNIQYLFLAILTLSFYGSTLPWSFFGRTTQTEATKTDVAQAPLSLTPAVRFTLMIDPAGDERDPGREIGDKFKKI